MGCDDCDDYFGGNTHGVFCNIFIFYTSTAPGNTKAEATIEIAKPSGGRLSRMVGDALTRSGLTFGSAVAYVIIA